MTQKQLENFLVWLEDHTFWREDNDVTNAQVAEEYLRKIAREKLAKKQAAKDYDHGKPIPKTV